MVPVGQLGPTESLMAAMLAHKRKYATNVPKELPPDPVNDHLHKKMKAGTQRVAETGRGLGTGFQLLGCVEGDLGRINLGLALSQRDMVNQRIKKLTSLVLELLGINSTRTEIT